MRAGTTATSKCSRITSATHTLPPTVELTGHLCQGHCKSGPNVTINGKMYHEVDPIVIIGLLNHHVPKEKA